VKRLLAKCGLFAIYGLTALASAPLWVPFAAFLLIGIFILTLVEWLKDHAAPVGPSTPDFLREKPRSFWQCLKNFGG